MAAIAFKPLPYHSNHASLKASVGKAVFDPGFDHDGDGAYPRFWHPFRGTVFYCVDFVRWCRSFLAQPPAINI